MKQPQAYLKDLRELQELLIEAEEQMDEAGFIDSFFCHLGLGAVQCGNTGDWRRRVP